MPAPPDPFAHRPRRSWRRIAVAAACEHAEAVAELLVDLTGAGVECSPARAAADGSPRERIVAYLAEGPVADRMEAHLRGEIAALALRLPEAGIEPERSAPILEEDWGRSWKEHFRPFAASPRLVVKPSWESYAPKPGEMVIEMDPGMAFGTGLHPSTRLALALLEERFGATAPRRVLDLGTGTGILAMAAARWGAAGVTAADNDPDAVAAARANVERNALAGRVRVTGEPLAVGDGPFDLIVANISADVLESLAGEIVARLAPGAALVLSGILAGEQERAVREAYERLGLVTVGTRTEGEWAVLALTLKKEEIFELVDEAGRAIGRAPRAECHRNPALLHRAAHVVVLDGAGRLYLQKRALSKDIQPGKWDTSVGGHVDTGEDHEAAARREMIEELGLAGDLRFLYSYLWRTERESELVATFLHIAREEPRPDAGEVEEGRWFTRAEADALVTSGGATPNLAEELRRLKDCGEF